MENLIISLKVIAPLMIYMLLGVFFKRRGLISDKLNTDMNSFLVKVFLPVLMFKNIYQADLSGLNGSFGIYAGIANIVGWCLCYFIFSRIEKDPARVGSMVQGGFRSNAVIFGIPVAESLFGVGNTVEVALAIAVCVPVYNVFSVLVLEVCGQKAQMQKDAAAGKTSYIDGKHIETMTIIIKATDNSSYLNLVDALDEMQICSVGKYVIDKINDQDKKLLEEAHVKE